MFYAREQCSDMIFCSPVVMKTINELWHFVQFSAFNIYLSLYCAVHVGMVELMVILAAWQNLSLFTGGNTCISCIIIHVPLQHQNEHKTTQSTPKQ